MRARGPLTLLSALLVASGVLRLGGEAGAAFAVGSPQAAGNGDEVACDTPQDVAEVIAAFEERDARLSEREAKLAEDQRALSRAEAEITERLTELEAAEASLSETLALAETASESDLDRLVAVYENMKPAEAAALFGEMAPEFAAGFVGRMEPAAAAAIMAGLPPGSAYSISVILAGRNAGTPTE